MASAVDVPRLALGGRLGLVDERLLAVDKDLVPAVLGDVPVARAGAGVGPRARRRGHADGSAADAAASDRSGRGDDEG